MSKDLISKNNLKSILSQIRPNIVSKINDKDISQEQKDKLNKSDIIDTTTNSSGFLSDNGKYIKGIDAINEATNKTNNAYDIFKIKNMDKKWELKSTPPKPLLYFSSELYNRKVYCIGGTKSGTDVQIYDIETDTYNYGTPIPVETSYHASVIIDSKIYIISGYSNGSTINTVRIYDALTNTWSLSRPLNNGRYGHTCETYDNKIYSISGYRVETLEIYDTITDIITYGQMMPVSRYYISSALYNGKIYVGAGYQYNFFYYYDIKLDKWFNVGAHAYNSAYNDMILYKDDIYFIGGDYNYNYVVQYNIIKNSWVLFENMKYGRGSSRNIIYKDKLYCIGGTTNASPIECLHFAHTDYDITLSSNIQNKLDCITDAGLGNKILSNNGKYVDIPKGYRFMESNEVTSTLDEIRLYIMGGDNNE